MRIDVENGVVYLPNGGLISPELTPAQLKAQFASVEPYNTNPIPFQCFSAPGGQFQDYPLLVEFRFSQEMFISVDLHVDLGQNEPPIPFKTRTQEEIAAALNRKKLLSAQAKTLLDSFLLEHLGEPTDIHDARPWPLRLRRDAPPQSPEESMFFYFYDWGTVSSLFKDGISAIRVEYRGRRRLAISRQRYGEAKNTLPAAQQLRQKLLTKKS